MAKKKISDKISARSSKALSNRTENFLSQIKWGESYTSLFLGAVVVVVALILVFSFLKSRTVNRGQTGSTSTVSNEQQIAGKTVPKSYTVKEGDDLWTISEKIYGSGYNWVDLASKNKLENPGLLYVGTKLDIPNVEPKAITLSTSQEQQTNPIKGNSYKVVKGDFLWEIALRAYGDGYKWTEIAKVNNLTNPDLIFAGNVLKLPR